MPVYPPNSLADAFDLLGKDEIIIGRDPRQCDYLLDDLAVSRRHARLKRVNHSRYELQDLGSTNGTWVGGRRVTSTQLSDNDSIHISIYDLPLSRTPGTQTQVFNGAAVVAVDLVVKAHDKTLLHKLNFQADQGDFVLFMGSSGCGKSTLLKALNWVHPPTAGSVYLLGHNLATEFAAVKHIVGYVPQDDIVHRDLTIRQTLEFAARLRFPDTTSEQELQERIDWTLDKLKLSSAARIEANGQTKLVRDLSGGQRKRLCIAVELLKAPKLLFLDEPTSPLDPHTIKGLLDTLCELTKNGQAKTTVVMVTHKPEDLVAANKVAFLAKEDAPGDTTGGHVVYNDIRTGLEEYFTVDELTDIYAQLAPDGDVTRSKPVTTWARQWLKLAPQKPTPPPKASLEPDRVSAGRQFWWLLMRALQLRLNQPKELLGRLLGLPFVFAAIIFLAFRPLVVGALFTIAIAAILCAMINAGLEIVSERAIFNRERMVNLRLGPYVASKLTLQALLGGIQAFVLTGLLTLAYAHGQGNTSPWVRLAGDWWQPALFVWYLIWSASIMVLVISAWAKNAEKANLLLSGLLLVQLILSGVVSKISSLQFEFASYLSYSRWGTEGLARIQDGFPEPDPAGSYVSLSPPQGEELGVVFPSPPPSSADQTPIPPQRQSALKTLGYYRHDLSDLLRWANSYERNWLAIAVLNAFFLLLLLQVLRRPREVSS